jgi:short subunit dehydrogenase-like uncharacterized protein
MDKQSNWMIYGAYGYSGELVAEEAVRQGHRPVLAGRSKEKLVPVAERLGLDWVVADLRRAEGLAEAVAQVDLVFHAAGPFVHTCEPMILACLAAGTNYLDITGEIPVFQNTFSHDREALQKGVALISGVGFDVVATDCMVEYVASQVPNAVELEVAIDGLGGASAGTTKTILEMLPQGGWRRRDGQLVPYRWGKGARKIRFSHGERTVVPVPWGDLATAFQTTGIPNITTYAAFPKHAIRILRWTAPVSQRLLALKPVRRVLQRWVGKTVRGPDEETRQRERAYVWVRAADEGGRAVEAWLETAEAYRFTAAAGVRCVERVLEDRPVGALTPALAFGADFVLEIEGAQRLDELP